MSLSKYFVAVVLTVSASPAPGGSPGGGPAGLVTVDQGLEDLHPLATSLRVDTSVQPPTDDFVNVYEDPAHPGRFIRTSGAIHAVFANSTYAYVNGRALPTIPAGTVFYYGTPTDSIAPGTRLDLRTPDVDPAPRTARVRPVRVAQAINSERTEHRAHRIEQTRIDPSRPTHAVRIAHEPQQTMSDELYRRDRLRSIAERAPDGE